jgi:hypothetical protein
MANKTASLKVTLTYAAPGGGNASVSFSTLAVPYQAQNESTIDVPATTAAATEYQVPFGSIEDGATLLIVVNRTDFPLTLKLNGGDLEQAIPVGEFAIVELGTTIGASPVTAASVTTTDIQGAEAGSVDCFVFGDPV